MVWSSLDDFLNMGGYATYVWGSLVMTFVLLVLEVMMLRKRRSSINSHLRDDREGGVSPTDVYDDQSSEVSE